MDWATTKRRRRGSARTLAASVVSADIALAAWALAAGRTVVTSSGGLGVLYSDYQSAVGSVTITAFVISMAAAAVGGLAWHVARERPRLRGMAGSQWLPADRILNFAWFMVVMLLARLGVLSASGAVSAPDEATMTFVVDHMAAALPFAVGLSVWACGWILGTILIAALAEDVSVAASKDIA